MKATSLPWVLMVVFVLSWGVTAGAAELPGTGDDAGKTVVYRDTWGVPHIYAPSVEAGFYAMGWAQCEDRPTPVWPEGISISCFDPDVDLEQAFLANRDAFKDHWSYTDSSEEEGLKHFQHRISTDPDFDPSLWYLAREGSEIAGICRVQPLEGADRSTGYVQSLGVRRPWRRRGLALALLHHAFGELMERGYEGCALRVDSDSLTGATRVYEKAGMHVAELNHVYELELRPGIDPVNRG